MATRSHVLTAAAAVFGTGVLVVAMLVAKTGVDAEAAPPEDTAIAEAVELEPAADREMPEPPPEPPSADGAEADESAQTADSPEEPQFLAETDGPKRKQREEVAELDAEDEPEGERIVVTGHDGLGLVHRFLNYGDDVSEVLSSYASMRAHIKTDPGPVRRIKATGVRTPVDLSDVAAGQAVLEFGRGVFVLDGGAQQWNVPKVGIQSLEIRGAGTDRTRLVGPGWAFLCVGDAGEMRNLVIRDLTIDSTEKDQIVLDSRGGMSVALERVRMDGWVVAGHAAAIGVTDRLFLAARDCEFRGSGDGWALSLRGPALAHFDRCRFTGARAALIASHKLQRPSEVYFRDCRFEDVQLSDRDLRHGATGGAKVFINGGRVEIGASGWKAGARADRFGEAMAAATNGLTYRSTEPILSPADALLALDLAAQSGLGPVAALTAHPGGPGEPIALDFFVPSDKPGERTLRQTRVFNGRALTAPAKAPSRHANGSQAITAADLAVARPLADLVRGAGIAADEHIISVTLRPLGVLAGVRRVLCRIRLTGGGLTLDAATGKPFTGR